MHKEKKWLQFLNIVLNGAHIGKLSKEVLPPQVCVAGGTLSSSWAGQGATDEAGRVSTTAAAARRSSEAAGGAG